MNGKTIKTRAGGRTRALVIVALAVLCPGILLPGCSSNPNKPDPKLPEGPSDLQCTVVSNSQIDLTWIDNATNEDGFKVFRETNPGSSQEPVTVLGSDKTAFQDDGLNPSTTYHYRVVAYNGAGVSKESATGSATTTGGTGMPHIALSSQSASFQAQANGADPAPKTIQVTNSGGGTLEISQPTIEYRSGEPTGWLAASLGGSTAPTSLTLSATTGSLAATTYHATVAVLAPTADNSPQNVEVAFTVSSGTGAPAIALSSASLSFSALQGGLTTNHQQVSIANGGGGSLTGLAVDITYGAGQPTGWLDYNLGGTTAPVDLTLWAAPGSLSQGTYTASVAVSSPVAGNSPQNIAVTFTVNGPQSGPELEPPAISGDQVTLTWTFDWPQYASSNDAYLLEESTSTPHSGYTQIGSYQSRNSPYSVTLTRSPGTYYYRVRARTCFGLTAYSQTRGAVVGGQTRSLRITNSSETGLFLDRVVQMKIIPVDGTFGTADLLGTDNRCWDIPQAAIQQGQSRSFEVTIGQTYWIMIGLGKWECDGTGEVCPSYNCWWERRYFTTPQWENYWVWVAVAVDGHQSGEWEWRITGSYLSGTLKVTPAGNNGIPFNVTNWNPIPGTAPKGVPLEPTSWAVR